MMSLKKYILSFRLRTLPLSMSGIILGSGWAYGLVADKGHFWLVFAFAILTTLSLQILSNLCNELGDSQHGTDDEQTTRQQYGLQSGAITMQEMKTVIAVFIALCVLFGTILIWLSFGTLLAWKSLVFLLLGALAIVGAMTYTLGKHSYGYVGLGDLGVFLFFGLLSTMGSYYLLTETVTLSVFLAATAIGMPIVGVLNLNNVRDIDNDRRHGKRTLASLMGKRGGKIYHTALLATCFLIFLFLQRYWTLLTLPIIVWHIWYIWHHDGRELDRQMPVLMFTTIIIAILACF